MNVVWQLTADFCKMFSSTSLRTRSDWSPASPIPCVTEHHPPEAGLSWPLRQPCCRSWSCFELKQPLLLTKSQVNLCMVALLKHRNPPGLALASVRASPPGCTGAGLGPLPAAPSPPGSCCFWVVPETIRTCCTGTQPHCNQCYRILDKMLGKQWIRSRKGHEFACVPNAVAGEDLHSMPRACLQSALQGTFAAHCPD